MTAYHRLPETFLLKSETARILYRRIASLPIIDYHCHLNPREIWENRPAESLGKLWLVGDHYKWRLMRAAGVEERLITGGASFDEKFMAFAAALPLAAGNPVSHWVKMELAAWFGIREPLNPDTADSILRRANEMIREGGFAPRELMTRAGVEVVCTTDDPADDLKYHRLLRDTVKDVRVLPTFRPDMAVAGILRSEFPDYVRKLTGGHPATFENWLDALEGRLEYFIQKGCRITDLSLADIPPVGSAAEAKAAFDAVMSGRELSAEAADRYSGFLLSHLAGLYAGHGLVMQLHLSALRNNRSALLELAGTDCGNDSVGPAASVTALGRWLDHLDRQDKLPRMLVYSLNPAPLYEIATMLGNFNHGFNRNCPGKLQIGAAWWHLDHIDGITEQLKAAANTGTLGLFPGMLTDSRSFLSYPRHDYFRRILCNLLGGWVEEESCDMDTAIKTAEAVAYGNAFQELGVRS